MHYYSPGYTTAYKLSIFFNRVYTRSLNRSILNIMVDKNSYYKVLHEEGNIDEGKYNKKYIYISFWYRW